MKHTLLIFLSIFYTSTAFSQGGLTLQKSHDDKFFIFISTHYGGIFSNVGTNPPLEDCSELFWTFAYDTNQVLWYNTHQNYIEHYTKTISNLIYHSPNSSKVAMHGGLSFNGLSSFNSATAILELNHQTGAYSKILTPQYNIKDPTFRFIHLHDFDNGDWIFRGSYYDGSFHFQNNPNVQFSNLSSSEIESIIVKFDSTNQIKWHQKIEGDNVILASDIAPNGNTYVFGQYLIRDSLQLGNLSIDAVLPATHSDANGFVGILDSNGTPIKFKKLLLDKTEFLYIEDVHFTNNAYYLTGYCRNTVAFDSTNYTHVNGSTGNFDLDWVFVAKYDLNTDSLIWLRHSYSDDAIYIEGSAMDNEGNIYIGGNTWSFTNSWAFDTTSAYFDNNYIVKFDSLGNVDCVNELEGFTPILRDVHATSDGKIVGLMGEIQYLDNISLFTVEDCHYDTIDVFTHMTCFISTHEAHQLTNIKVFPNPASDVIQLEFLDNKIPKNGYYKLLSAEGKLLKEATISDIQTPISIRDLTSGMYWLQIVTEEGIIMEKVIKM